MPDAAQREAHNASLLLLEYSRSLREKNPIDSVVLGNWDGAALLSRADGSASIVRPLAPLERLLMGGLHKRDGCGTPAVAGRLLGGLLGGLPAVVSGLELEGFSPRREVIPALLGVRPSFKPFLGFFLWLECGAACEGVQTVPVYLKRGVGLMLRNGGLYMRIHTGVWA